MIPLVIWLPPLAWMAAILWFSSADFSAEHTAGLLRPVFAWVLPWISPGQIDLLHAVARKLAHVVEYAILAALWFRALVRGSATGPRVASWLALAIAVGWAGLDEWHQSTLDTRTGSLLDVGLDTAGAAAALVVARAGWERAADRTTSAVLWAAVVGGTLVMALNVATGVGAGVLWVTVPVAALALMVRWRAARGAAPAGRRGDVRP